MEDNSYVSLSLEKYNELYDKARKYDDLKEQFDDEIINKINEALDGLLQAINSYKETAATTEEVVEEDYQYKVRDLVEIVKDNGTHGDELRIGNLYTIVAIDPDDSEFKYKLNNEYHNWVCDEEIKLVKKGEEN